MDMLCEAKKQIPSEKLRSQLGLGSIENALRWRLCWHVQRMNPDTWPRKVDMTIVTGYNLRGRPRKTWLQYIKKDLAVKGFDALLVHNRKAWRRAVHCKSRSGCGSGVVQPLDTGNNAR